MTALLISLTFFCLLGAYVVFVWSLYIRRWHDLGYSGWMSLLSLIPFVNLVVLIYLLCAKGEEGTNEYGEPNVGKPFWRSAFRPGTLKVAAVQPATMQPAALFVQPTTSVAPTPQASAPTPVQPPQQPPQQ